MESMPVWLPVVFFLVALLYATAGLGGGSSYLAILVLIGLSYQVIPQMALVCNVIVSGGGVWHFCRGRHFDWNRVMPFLVLSMPMAFLGGRLQVGKEVFAILLGVSLLAAGTRMFLRSPNEPVGRGLAESRAWLIGVPVGAALGFLAGIVGIGGGIFLAPVLILTGWANAKQTAAAASLFVLLNSASGFLGQMSKGLLIGEMMIPLAVAVLLGGQIGSRLSAYRLSLAKVRHVLAMMIVVVSLRLIWGAL